MSKTRTGWTIYYWLRAHHHIPFLRNAHLIFDPVHSGGLLTHLSSYWLNVRIHNTYDLWHRPKRWLWKKCHPVEATKEQIFWEAVAQASQEDLLDPLPDLSQSADPVARELGKIPTIGGVFGKRYFDRLKEILDEKMKGH